MVKTMLAAKRCFVHVLAVQVHPSFPGAGIAPGQSEMPAPTSSLRKSTTSLAAASQSHLHRCDADDKPVAIRLTLEGV
jgi:hypothetical protein